MSVTVSSGAGMSARDRRALLILAPCVAVILLVRFVLLPLWDAASDSSQTLAVREKMLHKYRAARNAVPSHELSATSLTTALDDAEKGLLTSPTPPLQSAEVQQLVRDLASNAGIQLRSVEFTTPKEYSEDYMLVGVATQFNAPIDQAMAFLNALEASPRILGVDHLRINAANLPGIGKDPGKKQVAVSIAISGVARVPASESKVAAK